MTYKERRNIVQKKKKTSKITKGDNSIFGAGQRNRERGGQRKRENVGMRDTERGMYRE